MAPILLVVFAPLMISGCVTVEPELSEDDEAPFAMERAQPGPSEFTACLDAHIDTPPLLTTPEYTLYACSADRPWPVLARVAGPHPVQGEAGLRKLRALLTDDELLAIPGVIGIETTLCCDKTPAPPLCLGLYLQSNTTPKEQLLETVTRRIREAGLGCMGVNLTVVGTEAKRCDVEADDSCEPVAYCSEETSNNACCDGIATYRPEAERVLLPPAFAELNRGACKQDGECIVNGSGNYCTAWTEPGFFAPYVCVPGLARAYCGCVQESCAWFTQP